MGGFRPLCPSAPAPPSVVDVGGAPAGLFMGGFAFLGDSDAVDSHRAVEPVPGDAVGGADRGTCRLLARLPGRAAGLGWLLGRLAVFRAGGHGVAITVDRLRGGRARLHAARVRAAFAVARRPALQRLRGGRGHPAAAAGRVPMLHAAAPTPAAFVPPAVLALRAAVVRRPVAIVPLAGGVAVGLEGTRLGGVVAAGAVRIGGGATTSSLPFCSPLLL
mmetsp:Transcript_53189/g.140679  ORF Transcript_53189/g.140679 Transcript_53189/m.140679 type:complete len:218 (-) Transcript_53189:877-1530(-)